MTQKHTPCHSFPKFTIEEARHIVHCVNMHDELVDALDELVGKQFDKLPQAERIIIWEKCQAILNKEKEYKNG